MAYPEMVEAITTVLSFIKKSLGPDSWAKYRDSIIALFKLSAGCDELHSQRIRKALGNKIEATLLHNDLSEWTAYGSRILPVLYVQTTGNYDIDEEHFMLTRELGLVELDEIAAIDPNSNMVELYSQLKKDAEQETKDKIDAFANRLGVMGFRDGSA